MSVLSNLAQHPVWTQLAEREKRLVMGLGLFLVVVALYSLIWSPVQTAFKQQTLALQKAEKEWLWLVEQAPNVPRGSVNNALNVHSKTALMDALQKSLRQQRLLQFTEGLNLTNRGVAVSFEKVDAPRLFRWIGGLEQKGLMANSMKLTPLSAGLVQADIMYEVSQ